MHFCKKVPMKGNSKEVESNQEGIHRDLEKLVLRYLSAEYKRPIADHTKASFEKAARFLEPFRAPVVLDSGCGTGLSTLSLAKRYPENPVLGIDKSEIRIGKAELQSAATDGIPSNVLFVRAELVDFWRLALQENWDVRFHALFYPNPWPKQSELRYRFHAHPVFPTLLRLSPEIELRTNWKIYADEFRAALETANEKMHRYAKILEEEFSPKVPVSAFEKKFMDSGHTLFRVTAGQ